MFSKDKLPIILFLFLAGVINYLDRSALSIAAPFIQDDLTLSATQMGLIFSSFSVGYAIFNFLGGVASDRYGAKLTLFVAMVVWSLFSGAVALAFGFVSLLIIRILFGMGEGPLSATINKMVNNWFPPTQRASVIGVTNSGTPLGGAISGPIVGMIAVVFSWKLSFVLIMIIGLICSALVQVCQRKAVRDGEGSTGNQSRNVFWRKNAAHLLPEAKNGPVHGVRFFRLQLHPLLLFDVVSKLSCRRAGLKC